MSMESRRHFNFCLAWIWEFDRDFANILERVCQESGMSLLQVQAENLETTFRSLTNGELVIETFLDRASDAEAAFLPLAEEMGRRGCRYINPLFWARQAWDKSCMHRLLGNAGIPVPHTVILPPYNEQPDLGKLDIQALGRRFVVKPAHGGGSDGVVMGAASLETVHAVRREYAGDAYLLQETINPRLLDGRPGWFRLLYCSDSLFPFWWNPRSHIYTCLNDEERQRFGLQFLDDLMRRARDICRLDLFSSEIAIREDGSPVVVDYVNDPVDLRLQSNAVDGVPDDVVWQIARNLLK